MGTGFSRSPEIADIRRCYLSYWLIVDHFGHVSSELVLFNEKSVSVLHLRHFLHQEELIEREAMVQNP